MEEKQLLLIPGPTPVPPAVLRAGAKPMINHRGPEFTAMQAVLDKGLAEVFQTKNDVLILTASGTGGLEAAVVNLLSPGDRVLSVSIGEFGERFAKIAQAFGAQVEKLDFEWGQAADPEAVQKRLKQDKNREIKAVLVTHNETSTGVMNDVAAFGRIVREHGALFLVDAISSLIALDLQTDAWHCDVVVAASQKAFMVPPGLSFASVSERAWAAYKQANMPRYYWDLGKAKDFALKGQTPWTPALPQYFGLRESLRLIKLVGLPNCFARHARLGAMARAGAQGLGLSLLADPKHASNCVTAIKKPEGVETAAIRKLMLQKYGIVLAGGQGHMKEAIFRLGHLGYVNEMDVLTALGALGMVLVELGVKVDPAAGVAAAQAALGPAPEVKA